MLIKWNKQNVKTITVLPVHGKPLPRKSFEKFLPGVNEIPDNTWELIKEHLKDSIARGDMEVIEEKTQSAPGKPALPASKLSDLTANKAIALVKETLNPDTLNAWLGEPGLKDAVRLHVEERIKELGIVRAPIEPTEDETPVFIAPENKGKGKGKDDEPTK